MSIEIFGYISGIGFFLGYIPQLIRTYRLKSVDDLSPLMWWLTLGAYLTGLVYGIWLGKYPLILSYSLGFSCTLIMVGMIRLYRDPRRDMNRRIVRRFINEAKKRFKKEG